MWIAIAFVAGFVIGGFVTYVALNVIAIGSIGRNW